MTISYARFSFSLMFVRKGTNVHHGQLKRLRVMSLHFVLRIFEEKVLIRVQSEDISFLFYALVPVAMLAPVSLFMPRRRKLQAVGKLDKNRFLAVCNLPVCKVASGRLDDDVRGRNGLWPGTYLSGFIYYIQACCAPWNQMDSDTIMSNSSDSPPSSEDFRYTDRFNTSCLFPWKNFFWCRPWRRKRWSRNKRDVQNDWSPLNF